MIALGVLAAWAGAAVALLRLGARPSPDAPPAPTLPRVSVIIPARNEAIALPLLLASLKSVDYPALEVIVVDDGSDDRTGEVAAAMGARVIKGAPLPPGWTGKNWACHQGAAAATGELLLFTDADTVHRPDGLRRAVDFLSARDADLVSALPFHRCPTLWERWMGPFHALLLVATAHRAAPKRDRLFAIGQFLLFRRAFYERLGGHAGVAARYPDDLALAGRTIDAGGRYAFHAGRPYYEVRMYPTFDEFLNGWRRNIAAGLRLGRWTAALETALVIIALLAGGRPEAGAAVWTPALLVAALIAVRQRAWGEFSLAGALFYPIALSAYLVATALAAVDLLRGGRLGWKGRTLDDWTPPS